MSRVARFNGRHPMVFSRVLLLLIMDLFLYRVSLHVSHFLCSLPRPPIHLHSDESSDSHLAEPSLGLEGGRLYKSDMSYPASSSLSRVEGLIRQMWPAVRAIHALICFFPPTNTPR